MRKKSSLMPAVISMSAWTARGSINAVADDPAASRCGRTAGSGTAE